MAVRRLDEAGLAAVASEITDPAVLARYRAKVATVPGSECLWSTGACKTFNNKTFNKKHDLPAATIEAVEDALVADRQELGRMLARSAFAQEVVFLAAEEARRRPGREL